MGSNKALIEIGGRKVIDILLAKLRPISRKIIIVLGDNFAEVENYLQKKGSLDSDLSLIYNEDHQQGMFTSILKGFSQTSGKELVLLQMIDQPFVELEIYEQLIRFVDNENLIFQPAVAAERSLKPGHPLLFSAQFRQLLMANKKMDNLRDVIRSFQSKRKFLITDRSSIFLNLNTPEEVEKYLETE